MKYYLAECEDHIHEKYQLTLMKASIFVTVLYLVSCFGVAQAQPSPGDLFKEYTWHNEWGDCNGALRVGGKLDYQVQGMVIHYKDKGLIVPPFQVDLKKAIKAELVVEKMLCHGGTKGLRVSINGKDPVPIPEAVHIPRPQSDYAHHYNAIVPLALSDLKPGNENTFRFEVDTSGQGWPQNLLYGMILRIYYEDEVLQRRGRITYPKKGATLGEHSSIWMWAPDVMQIKEVNLIGYYEEADLEGDGLYRQWHYAYHKGEIYNHIGTFPGPPFEFKWSTDWLPDQSEAMKLAAFIHRNDGFIYMTGQVDDLNLERSGISVELCKPYRRPKGWFTRNGESEERFQVKGDLEQAVDAKMVFRSWSPGYFNGIYLNDFIVFTKDGPKYAYYEHHIPIEDLSVLKQGENKLKTGKTPPHDGQVVHGVEIQWPGIMVLIKYKTRTED
ncbi:MAG: hypothetical protein ABFS28_01070 [Bacteroidota bacterium]